MPKKSKKERYVIYVEPKIGEALRRAKSRKVGETISAITESALRKHLRRELTTCDAAMS